MMKNNNSLKRFMLFLPLLMLLVVVAPTAVAEPDVFKLENDIKELEVFAKETDSYLADLKSHGYDIAAEEILWNTMKGLISEAKKEFEAKNYFTVERLLEKIEDLYHAFFAKLSEEVSRQNMQAYYVDWFKENEKGIDDYLNELKGQGYDVTGVMAFWQEAKKLYKVGIQEFEAGNYDKALELFRKGDKEYANYAWEIELLLLPELYDEAIEALKEAFGWYDDWLNKNRAILEKLDKKGYDTSLALTMLEEIEEIHDIAFDAYKKEEYAKSRRILAVADAKIDAFEAYMEELVKNVRVQRYLERQLGYVKEWIAGSVADLKNPEFLSTLKENGVDVKEVEAALKEIEDKYSEATQAFADSDYEKALELLKRVKELISSYELDYYYSFNIPLQIEDMESSLKLAVEWINIFKADLSNPDYPNWWTGYGTTKEMLESEHAGMESDSKNVKKLLEEASKLFGTGKRAEAKTKVDEASNALSLLWDKIEKYKEKYDYIERTEEPD